MSRKLDLHHSLFPSFRLCPACRCHIHNLTSRFSVRQRTYSFLSLSCHRPSRTHLHTLSSTPSGGRMLRGSTQKDIHKFICLDQIHESRSQCLHPLSIF